MSVADSQRRADCPVRVHGITHHSRVNGPGERAVVHFQGCSLGCSGCFNPLTHTTVGGRLWSAADLADELTSRRPDGVTISGGEPFEQPDAFAALTDELRKRDVNSIVVFSGYTLAEIRKMPRFEAELPSIDVLIAGRFDGTKLSELALLASANQKLHLLTDAHSPAEFAAQGAEVEITIAPDGRISMTGFPSGKLRGAVQRLR
jgi:anaerobic ribonucleoside-triphosphate reductase activating protein